MAVFNEDIQEEYFVIKGENPLPCVACKTITPYIDIVTEEHCCSTECHTTLYDGMS